MRRGYKLYSKSLIVATLSLSTVLSGLAVIPSNIEASEITSFNDYNPNAYWADSFEWGVNKGLISGYTNTTQPGSSSKQVGNWLAPEGKLSESQAVTVMMKYFEDARLKTTSNPTSHWAGSSLQLAKELGVPLRGGVANVKASDNYTMTRGDFAMMLANLHFGRVLTQANAIQFMYDTGITSGMTASGGKTIANFGTNVALNRAHIVSFMQRYNDYISTMQDTNSTVARIKQPNMYNGIIPSQKNTVIARQGAKAVASREKITVRYGNHTYGSKNQAEYDAVMKIVDQAVKGIDSVNEKNSYLENRAVFNEIMNGQFHPATTTMDRNTDAYGYRLSLWQVLNEIVSNGESVQQIIDMIHLNCIEGDFENAATTLSTGEPNSAYDILVRKVTDCDADAQLSSALYDILGYNTAVVGVSGHSYVAVEINGKWYGLNTTSPSLVKADGSLPEASQLLSQVTR